MRAGKPLGFLIFMGAIVLAAGGGETGPGAPQEIPAPGLSAVAALGERLFRDTSLSASGELACESCFTYDNVGVPRNARLPANAEASFHDLGLCGPERKDLAARREFCGAFKVPTLRNVARTAPHFHNGAIAALRDVVEFYVTRDTAPGDWYPSGSGGPQKFDDLPAGLVTAVNTSEVPYDREPGGEPALTPAEIDDVVAFLRTLDDGYN